MLKQPKEPSEDGEATRHPNGRFDGRFARLVAVPAVVLGVVAAVIGLSSPTWAWQVGTPTVQAICDGGKAVINGTFTNNETAADKGMNVIMSYGSLADGPKAVAPQSSTNFSINTGQQSLQPGMVKFDMTWANGTPGTDSIGANFGAVNCGPPDDGDTKKIAYCHATGSTTNPYVFIETSVNAFFQAGHIDHPNDIWPAFSYTKNGQMYNVPAQGDQSLLVYRNPDCVKPSENTPVTPADVTFNDECGTANDTYTVPAVVEGAQYIKDGQAVAAGTYPGSGTVTIVPQALLGYVLAPSVPTQWSHTYTNEDCNPPSVASYNGQVTTTCHAATGTGYVDDGYGSSVTFTLKVGQPGHMLSQESFTVEEGSSGQVTVPGSPGDQARLFAKGKAIAVNVLKKDCGAPPPPPPVCQQNCSPAPPTPPVSQCTSASCVPTATAETGLGTELVGKSSQSPRGADWTDAGLLLMTVMLGSLAWWRRPALRRAVRRR